MTTVISVYTSEGCVGRCDAHCHDAVTSICNCVCGGRLHGVGRGKALEVNTWALFGPGYHAAHNAETWARERGLDLEAVRVTRPEPAAPPAAQLL